MFHCDIVATISSCSARLDLSPYICMHIHAKKNSCMHTHVRAFVLHIFFVSMHAGQFFSASATGAHAPGGETRRLPSESSLTWSTWVPASDQACTPCIFITCMQLSFAIFLSMCNL